jgi:hypothetical protein
MLCGSAQLQNNQETIQQVPSLEAKTCSANEYIPHILYNWMVHNCANKSIVLAANKQDPHSLTRRFSSTSFVSRNWKVPTMVHKNQNHKIYERCPSFVIPYN